MPRHPPCHDPPNRPRSTTWPRTKSTTAARTPRHTKRGLRLGVRLEWQHLPCWPGYGSYGGCALENGARCRCEIRAHGHFRLGPRSSCCDYSLLAGFPPESRAGFLTMGRLRVLCVELDGGGDLFS